MKHFLTLALTCLPLLCIGAPSISYTSYFNNTHTYTNATVAGASRVGSLVSTNGVTSQDLTADRAAFTDSNKKLVSTGTSAALSGALSDETGSGGVAVFNLSPTITTPTIDVVLATKAFRSYQGTLTHAGSMALDFDATTTVNTISLTGAVTFTTSNLATNRTYRLLIKNVQATNCTPTFPSWKFLGGAPSTITAGQWGMLSLEAWGTTDASVVAAYAESQ